MPNTKQIHFLFNRVKGRKPTILVVEGEVLLRVALSDYLRECGFRVYEAGNGEEAITLLKSRKVIVDVVLSDADMPEGDGFAVSHWINTYKPGLPILLVSGDRKKSDAAKNLCETDPTFTKPYDLKKVVAFVRNAINAKSKKRSA
jgi:DNA-binding response OmpR family regulator